MNKVYLIGNMTREPELAETPSGVAVARFSIAVSRQYQDSNGERQTDFFNCTAWRGLAETIAKYCKKGSQIGLEGRIQTRTYDAKDGTKRYVTEVLVENFYLLGSKPEKKEPTDSQIVQAVMNDEDPFVSFGNEVVIEDSDLPF